MEEFCESEVMWPESHQGRPRPTGATRDADADEDASSTAGARRRSSLSGPAAAAPVGIPSATGRGRGRGRERELGSSGEEEEEDDGGEMVPPHVLVSLRRASGKVAYSLCTGHGRTLKGRDLRHVRDAVLRMTGFLEG